MPSILLEGIPVLWEEHPPVAERKLVIWLPGFTDRKEGMLAHLRALAAAGYVALSFDPVDHGARSRTAAPDMLDPTDGSFRSPTDGHVYRHFWSILAQTAADVPSIIDWAVTTLGVAPAVGMGGISMGGSIAVVAAALDQRITVVSAGIAEADWLRPGSTIPLHAPNADVQASFDRCNPLTNLARYRHCPALSFQCGADDPLCPPDGALRFVRALRATYAACPEKLEIVLEEGVAHAFTPRMWLHALDWFAQFLY